MGDFVVVVVGRESLKDMIIYDRRYTQITIEDQRMIYKSTKASKYIMCNGKSKVDVLMEEVQSRPMPSINFLVGFRVYQ